MPYANKERQREYQRAWMAKRRAEFFGGKACLHCGSTESLELDHINSNDKVDHRIWSWTKERRDKELEKCQVLCHDCHLIKTAEHQDNYTLCLTDAEVQTVKKLLRKGTRGRTIAKRFGVAESVISRIKLGKSYEWVA